MNIRGVGSNNLVNFYVKHQTQVENKSSEYKKDSIEISSIGKSLSSLDIDVPSLDNTAKIEKIKEEINKGTYNVDAKLTAQKLLDIMKGREA
ncbi:flagellar biosynthesis anti-sigma factor FlgM [Clostridium polynesiense]|uniref:flagellar biosynthesis anti-sigma factor FlgM n=1 Tax=Clostridium polynesiense TaxID=1325933 RepID=UPI00058B5ABE|nr:flagellar biosynthesis anti-sigma factor FlgM [Clostridium polynesiense]